MIRIVDANISVINIQDASKKSMRSNYIVATDCICYPKNIFILKKSKKGYFWKIMGDKLECLFTSTFYRTKVDAMHVMNNIYRMHILKRDELYHILRTYHKNKRSCK